MSQPTEDQVPHESLTTELTGFADGAAILRLKGEVDISSAPKLSEQFELVASKRYSALVIDTTGVSFMDSSGLHALVEGKRLLHQSDVEIALVPSDQVRRVMELVFPDPLFASRVDTIDEATEVLGIDQRIYQGGISG